MVARPVGILFEDALDETGFGKYNYMMLVLCSGVIVAMVFEILSVGYLVPTSACELGTSSVHQGLMAGMPLVGVIATSQIWGYLADTRGRKKSLCLSLILGFCAGFLATFSPNWIVFSIFKLVSSSAVSGTYAIAFTLLSECTPKAKRNSVMILMNGIFLSAAGFIAVIAIPIMPLKFSYHIPYLDIYFNSWRLMNLILSCPSALGAAGVYFSYESPKYLLSIGEHLKALEVMKSIFAMNSGKGGDEFRAETVVLDDDTGVHVLKSAGLWQSIKSQTLPLVKPPLLKETLLMSLMFCIVYFCFNPYVVWLPYMADGFMRSILNGDEGLTFCQMLRSTQNSTLVQSDDCSLNQLAMVMVFAVGMMSMTLNTIMSAVVVYCGRKRIFIFIQLLAGAAALCVNFSYDWILSAILYITYISGVLNFGLLTTFSVEMFPTYLKAMAVCLTLLVGRGSAVIGINILKNLLISDCESSFYVFGGITVVGGVIGFLLPSDVRIAEKRAIT